MLVVEFKVCNVVLRSWGWMCCVGIERKGNFKILSFILFYEYYVN